MQAPIKLALALVVLVATACGKPTTGSELAATHQRSNDVSVIIAARDGEMCFRDRPTVDDNCSGGMIIDAGRCHEIRREDHGDFLSVLKDCRDEVARVKGTKTIMPVLVSGRWDRTIGRFYYDEFEAVTSLLVTIKKASFDASSFVGLGMSVDLVSYSYFDGPSGPNGSDVGLSFTRDELLAMRQPGEVTLKNGEAAYVFKLLTVTPFAHGGSSSVNGQYFRPYARFAADGAEFFNWDDVASDYFLDVRTSFDRRRDVLR